MPRARSPFVAVLADLKRVLAALQVDWYLFGAQAALIHGASRATADVDVTVRLGATSPTRLASTLTQRGFELRIDNPSFVRRTRVLPIVHVATSIPVDLVFAGPGLEEAFLQGAKMRDFGGVRVPVASAEDLIVMKILAGRDKDLDDVLAIVQARGAQLDAKRVLGTLAMVEEALGQSDLVPTWQRLARVRAGSLGTRKPKRNPTAKKPVTRRKRASKKRTRRRS